MQCATPLACAWPDGARDAMPAAALCTLGAFRLHGPSSIDGCVEVDLGVPGAHWGDPFHKPPGLNMLDAMLLSPHLSNATALRTLRIRGLSGIHHTWEQLGIKADGMQSLAAALPAGIEVLEISGHNIGNSGAAALAAALKTRLTGMRELNLALNSITDEGALALAGVLGALPSLDRLNLEHNWIGTSGSEALARALSSGRAHLRQLSLASNNLGERGGAALAGALASNRWLHTLNLYSNSIGTSGAVAFAATLAGGSSALADLNLAHNYIDADGEVAGASALSDAMRRGHTALRRLDLRWNHFTLCHCGSPARLRRAARDAPRLELVLERHGA